MEKEAKDGRNDLLKYGIAAMGLAFIFKKTPWTSIGKANTQSAKETFNEMIKVQSRTEPGLCLSLRRTLQYSRREREVSGTEPSANRLIIRVLYEICKVKQESLDLRVRRDRIMKRQVLERHRQMLLQAEKDDEAEGLASKIVSAVNMNAQGGSRNGDGNSEIPGKVLGSKPSPGGKREL